MILSRHSYTPNASLIPDLFLAVVLVRAGVDSGYVLRGQEAWAAEGVGAQQDAGGLYVHAGDGLHVANALSAGDEAVVLHQDHLWRHVLRFDELFNELAQRPRQRNSRIDVFHVADRRAA